MKMCWSSTKKFVIYCLFVLCWSVQECVASPYGNDITARSKPKASGCLHNNTMFADTSIVPSSEPCLVCKCSKRNLVCVRRVCKDQPYPPPRGCILVQKKASCCPYLSCSKYHVNFYKNSKRNHEHVNSNNNNNDHYQITHEKTLEKHYRRTDDDDEGGNDDAHQQHHDDMNGGCIESGSLYASGSAMYQSSATMCSYCYCINGQQKCIKPKCMLTNTRCKPIFMEASCCPVKYDCSHNYTTSEISNESENSKYRVNVCTENGRNYQEGERFPPNEQRPCEVCYCIKGVRKCVVKKCAPVIHGCVPKVPAHGACCPTSYDCRRRSLKFKRHSRQENEEEEEVEEDSDTIDFFSLLFGSDDPKEEEVTTEVTSTTPSATTTTITTTTPLPPFKSLPSTTESSFFDFIRAGLEIIDANADKIDAKINKVIETTSTESSRETFKTSTPPSSEIKSSSELKKLPSSTETPKTSPLPTSTLSTKSSMESKSTASSTQRTTLKTTSAPVKMSSTTATTTKAARKPTTTTRKTTSKAPSSSTTSTKKQATSTSTIPPKTNTAPPTITTSKRTTTRRTTTPTATTKVFSENTTRRPTLAPQKFIVPSLVETLQQQRLPSIVHFNADVFGDKKYTPDDADNEADTLPNLEIIPFVAHDAIRTDKYEPYLSQPYEHGLEKDYFASIGGGSGGDAAVKEKPFRYNNKFIHHNYDDSLDYVYSNPHERIDSGPYYFENQFDSFSPPNEQDFLGGFSPKETIYDGVSSNAKLPSSSPPPPPFDSLSSAHQSNDNDLPLKPLEKIHEHKSSLTSSDNVAATFAINQTTANQSGEEVKLNITTAPKMTTHPAEITTTTPLPGFKKIASNFTSFINDLLQVNALDETKVPIAVSTPRSTSTSTIKPTSTPVAPVKSIIDDDDFIKKHLKATSTSTTISKSSSQKQQQQAPPPPPPLQHKKQQPASMEIFSKPTNPTMNGLLKLAGCNIYGQMYEVGHVIAELSSACLECKCLPDIGVGCMQLC